MLLPHANHCSCMYGLGTKYFMCVPVYILHSIIYNFVGSCTFGYALYISALGWTPITKVLI